jgi:hypothetical protein
VAIDVKAILADGEFFYRNGTNVDGMSPSALATLMVAQAAIGTAATLDFDTDDTLAADSDTRIPTQQAVKAYVDASGGGVGNISDTDTDVTGWDFVLDEDDLASDSATKLPTQQSVKAYVDALPTIITSDTDIVPYSLVDGVVILDVDDLVTGSGSGGAFLETAFRIEDSVDGFQASFVTSGLNANRAFTFPDSAGTIVTTLSTDAIGSQKVFSAGVTARTNVGFGVGFNGVNVNARGNPIELHGNTSYAARLAFLHDSAGADPVQSSFSQTVAAASIVEIVARGHTGSPTTAAGYASGNQLRILGITTEVVQNTSRGAYWQFYTTETAGSSNRAVFRIFETGAFGYPHAAASGVGGTVTQATSKNTGVTLDKPTGQITTFNDSLAANANATFVLTNSTIGANDTVVVGIQSGATSNTGYLVTVTSTSAGSCRIMIRNVSGGALSDTLVLNYTVIKGAST